MENANRNFSLVRGDTRIYSPKLAASLEDINKAIILQDIYYWCQSNKEHKRNLKDGFYWMFSTYGAFAEKSWPWLSAATVKSKISDLERDGLVISGCFNKRPYDKTKWYRVDEDAVAALVGQIADESKEPETPVSLPYEIDIQNTTGFDTTDFQKKYVHEFKKFYNSEPPKVTVQQLETALRKISAFAERWDLSVDGMIELVRRYFANVTKGDHSICHFASGSIMEKRFYEQFL